MIHRVRPWLRSILLRRRLEREMQEEMAGHLERSVARLVARGLPEPEARREALREFGNLGGLQEEARDARGTRWIDSLAEDLRFALRHFRRRWGTTLTMFLILSSGIGIGTLLFSYVYWYAAQPPLGIARADDLVRIRGSQDAGGDGRGPRTFSHAELQEYAALAGHFRSVAGWGEAAVSVDAGAAAELRGLTAEATFVEGDYFGVLGVRPRLGPGLPAGPAEGSAALVAVIGHLAWEELYRGDPGAIGRTLQVNGVPVTIVGVAPPRFHGVGGGTRLQLWLPSASRRAVLPEASASDLAFRAAARLRPGTSREEAAAAVKVVAARVVAADEKLATRGAATEVVPLLASSGDPMYQRDVRLLTLLLGALATLVLGVACTNVGALQTGLALARRHEIAVRLSLGAARRRIVRQLLTESAFLSVLAGAAALALVWGVFAAAKTFFPLMPLQLSLTWPLAAFTFGASLVVGVAFGISPALHATRVAIATALKDSAGSIAGTRLRLQRVLVVAQVALTQPLIVLLVGALLAVLGRLQPADGNEHADRLIALRLRPATAAADPGSTARPDLGAELSRLTTRLETEPGVEAVVVDSESRGDLGRYTVHPGDRVRGGSQEAVSISGRTASPGYLAVAGVPLLRGRELTRADERAAAAGAELPVIVGGDLARRLWPGADPLGRRLRPAGDSTAGAPTLVVTGMYAEGEGARRDAGAAYPVFLPPPAGPVRPALLIRTVGPAEPLLPALRVAAREALPGTSATLTTVAALEDEARRTFRAVTGGLAGSGLVALLLAAIGLYAVVAFSVGQRSGEIAVRIAVGASPGRIARRFVADGLRMSALGLLLGLPVSLLGLRGYNLLTALEEEFPAVALPPVAATAMLAIVLVTLAATYLPARRASRVNPATALRRE